MILDLNRYSLFSCLQAQEMAVFRHKKWVDGLSCEGLNRSGDAAIRQSPTATSGDAWTERAQLLQMIDGGAADAIGMKR